MGAEVGQRRASYGPTSPDLGTRGSKTVTAILEAALTVFTRQGYHAATIADIAAEVGLSRAALYQYFESKAQIFVQLLEECGAAVVEVTRQLGTLGPTASGFANLRWWLAEWRRVYARYAVMFAEWTTIDAPDAPVSALVSSFNQRFSRHVARRLEESGSSGNPLDTAIVLTGVVLRWNRLQRTRHTDCADAQDEREYDFAVLTQLMLFPETPPAATGADVPRRWRTRRVSRRLETTPVGRSWVRRDPLGGLTTRSAATVRALLSSSAQTFAEGGFHGSSIDEIVSGAGYARGTFYKYFATKTEALEALAVSCTHESITAARRLAQVEGPADLIGWCRAIIALSAENRAVFNAWAERTPRTPSLDAMRADVVHELRRSLFLHLSGAERGHPIDLSCTTTFIVAVFDQIPAAFGLNRHPLDREASAELVASLLGRAVFRWTNG